jgi:hypothetical protein
LFKLAEYLEKDALVRVWVRINQSLTLFALLVATISFMNTIKKYETDQVKSDEDRIAKAWDVVSRMSGKQSNGGQVAALERLNAFGISLDYVDLHNTFVSGADLHGAKLRKANLSKATLIGVNFQGADLTEANLRGANFIGANLGGADLYDADFGDAKLIYTKIDLAIVLAKNLKNADLTGSEIVFEDTEGEEIWDSFSDSLAEARDLPEMQTLLDSACANPEYARKIHPLLEVRPPHRRCKTEPNYQLLRLQYPTR